MPGTDSKGTVRCSDERFTQVLTPSSQKADAPERPRHGKAWPREGMATVWVLLAVEYHSATKRQWSGTCPTVNLGGRCQGEAAGPRVA